MPASFLPLPLPMNENDQANFANALLLQINTLRAETRRNSGYLARQEIERLNAQLSAFPGRLEPYGYKVYSQADEDGILAEIFRRIGVVRGTFCEIGVENGLECNSLYLLHQGWRGAWLEGDASRQAAIVGKFGSLLRSARLAVGIGYIKPDNINATLQNVLGGIDIAPAELDLLSIDIDGMDIYLLEALACRPKVIIIEYNAKFPPPLDKRPVFDPDYVWPASDYMGSSLTALDTVAREKGYALVATNLVGTNAFFVRKDLLQDRFHADLSPECLYNPPRYYLQVDHFLGGAGHKPDFGRYVDLE